jgi:hypothetical protein
MTNRTIRSLGERFRMDVMLGGMQMHYVKPDARR